MLGASTHHLRSRAGNRRARGAWLLVRGLRVIDDVTGILEQCSIASAGVRPPARRRQDLDRRRENISASSRSCSRSR
jgi:hypothetical protein